ncbi:unnamed protein product [Dibothriocephalus latus]|uniref:Fibronectin type-III domain-containing protein n=1 Tax=Dibothriocephalus latus TaxID=60516 RepID=A0A3P6P1Z9_DIBLA|nr:unnamed protein product [Dibothriocephalus latus]
MWVQPLGLLTVSLLAFAGESDLAISKQLVAEGLDSSSLRVAWEPQSSSPEWGHQYLYRLYKRVFENNLKMVNSTGKLEPSSIYNFTVNAFDASGRPVQAAAFTASGTTANGNLPLTIYHHYKRIRLQRTKGSHYKHLLLIYSK